MGHHPFDLSTPLNSAMSLPPSASLDAPASTYPPTSPPSREAWATRYRCVRAFTEELCGPLQVEDYVIQSMPDASPAKWHLAHTSWFFQTFILGAGRQDSGGSDPDTSFLFNSYYNAVGPMHCRAQRGMISRPTVGETYQYRAATDQAMERLFADATDQEWEALQPIVELGLHHEQQHQELLLTDLKHLFAQNPLLPSYRSAPSASSRPGAGAPPLRWFEYPEGMFFIGANGNEFHFDNEGPRHRQFLHAFQLASRLVTNGEYLEFIEDGGYARAEFWLSLGWMTIREQGWQAPLYWEKHDGKWQVFSLHGLRPLDPNEPVSHVSFLEADAFARWKGARLPTEAEWEVASLGLPLEGNFVHDRRFGPAAAASSTAAHPVQMFGDVWEWTRSSYGPYPGYSPAEGAIGEYNGKFMCNQYVLRGGSCATSREHIRRTYRNFFPPDKRWQFSGIRLARDLT